MLHVDICQVEMHALHQHVCCYEHFGMRIMKYGAVVSHAVLCRFVFYLYVFSEMLYQSELTQS